MTNISTTYCSFPESRYHEKLLPPRIFSDCIDSSAFYSIYMFLTAESFHCNKTSLDSYHMANFLRITINIPLSFITVSNHCNHIAHIQFYIFSGDKVIKKQELDKMQVQNVNNRDCVSWDYCDRTILNGITTFFKKLLHSQTQNARFLCRTSILHTLNCEFLAFINT